MSAFLIASALAFTSCVPGAEPEGLVLQDLDYSEDPVDIPNPDRGFYRANDGMVVPVEGTGEEGTQMEVGQEPVTVGGAQVSNKHAGFIINKDNATANDVKSLIREVQTKVYDETGYDLECELIIL